MPRMSKEMRDAAVRAAEEAGLGELKGVYDCSRFDAWVLAVSGCVVTACLLPDVLIDVHDSGVSAKAVGVIALCLMMTVGMLFAARVLWRNAEGGIVHFEGGMVETYGAGSEAVSAWRDVTEVRRLVRNPIIPMYSVTAAGRRHSVARDDFSHCRPLLKDMAKLAARVPDRPATDRN